jgi:hypothetical protein
MFALCMFLLAASTRLDHLVDEVYQIPADEWRYVDIGLKQRPALVIARFDVESGAKQVRLALMRREDLERMRAGLPHGVIDETEPSGSGQLRPQVRGPAAYVLVVDNRGEAPASVHLRVSLDFDIRKGPDVTRLSPQRQLTVVAISFAVFFGIVTWSARRLLRGIRR